LDVLKMPGAHEIPVVRIKPLSDPSLSFAPAQVQAVLSVRESDVSYTIQSVPIWVYGVPGVLAKYRVECPATIPNVTATGPADKIDLLKRDDFSPKPRAMLEVRSDDAGRASQSRRVRFDFGPLDPSIRVNDEGSLPPVEFHLVEVRPSE
jgi:hypothetical protein